MNGDGVAIRQEGHVAFGFGQADKQCSVATGCRGATGKAAENLLVIGFFKETLFGPVP